jgi:NADH-quinone oxidoreductase subunit I
MIKSIIESFSNLFAKSETINYPYEQIAKFKNYRGLIEYSADECIFCYKCEKVCPPDAIVFKPTKEKNRLYEYNPNLCIYCGECVRNCPKEDLALWQSEKKPKII